MSPFIVNSRTKERFAGLITAMNVLLAISGAAAVVTLILWYGFREPPVSRHLLGTIQIIIVAVFVLDRVLRVMLARNRLYALKENWLDFVLIALAGIAAIVSVRMQFSIISAGALYVVITQVYLLVSLILRGVSVNLRLAGSGINPAWLLIGSFVFVILFGSALLMLPVATPEGGNILYEDALFTATSATCVTGLIVRDTGMPGFTLFGQAVILAMIQIGGLGIMMFGTVLAVLVGKQLSVRSSDALGQIFATDRVGQVGRVVTFVVFVTLFVEVIGAVLMYPMFRQSPPAAVADNPTFTAVWFSVFHSISSFCNAGFSLYHDNMMAGVAEKVAATSPWTGPLRNHWQIIGVMAPLIVLGGLGFPVLQDLAGYVSGWGRRVLRRLTPRRGGRLGIRPRLSLHSRVVLVASAILIILGAGILLLVEPRQRGGRAPGSFGTAIWNETERHKNDWEQMDEPQRVREAVFQSISARTAGFNTMNMGELSNAGKLNMCGLMVIGGSPAGTAGGMKTVTMVLLLVALYSVLRRRDEMELWHRSISMELIRRVVATAVLYLALLVVVTMLLCVALPDVSFMDVLFESCSACGTVGLSTGTTGQLNLFGKYIIIAGMFIGRLGPLTMLLAITSRMKHRAYQYPSETVVIG